MQPIPHYIDSYPEILALQTRFGFGFLRELSQVDKLHLLAILSLQAVEVAGGNPDGLFVCCGRTHHASEVSDDVFECCEILDKITPFNARALILALADQING